MKLLVLGASGGVGRHAVEEAVRRGHDVVALVRNTPARVDGAKFLVGDVRDEATLARALEGREAVVSCLGLRRKNPLNPWSKITSPTTLTTDVATLLNRLMPNGGVKRLVAISSAGVGDSFPRMNFLMRFLVRRSSIGVAYRDLANMEDTLSKGAIDWLSVRPVTLTNGKRTERVGFVERFGLTSTISRATVAAWMVGRAVDSEPIVERCPMIAAK